MVPVTRFTIPLVVHEPVDVLVTVATGIVLLVDVYTFIVVPAGSDVNPVMGCPAVIWPLLSEEITGAVVEHKPTVCAVLLAIQ